MSVVRLNHKTPVRHSSGPSFAPLHKHGYRRRFSHALGLVPDFGHPVAGVLLNRVRRRLPSRPWCFGTRGFVDRESFLFDVFSRFSSQLCLAITLLYAFEEAKKRKRRQKTKQQVMPCLEPNIPVLGKSDHARERVGFFLEIGRFTL